MEIQAKNDDAAGKNPRPPLWRQLDVLVVALLLAVAGVWLIFAMLRGGGAVAVVTVGVDEAARTLEVPLGRDDVVAIEGGVLPVTLEVRDGAVRFVDSRCPDHTCEGFGWLRQEGDWALCAPAGVMVRVEKG